MDRICDYCKCQFDDSLDKCPHCGAPNSYVRRGEGVPRTIEELKQWYIKMGLPLPLRHLIEYSQDKDGEKIGRYRFEPIYKKLRDGYG